MYQGYRLLAIDGTFLRLPTNKNDELSFLQNEEAMKGFNLMHLDAMYDLLRNIYVDVSLQMKKKKMNIKPLLKWWILLQILIKQLSLQIMDMSHI